MGLFWCYQYEINVRQPMSLLRRIANQQQLAEDWIDSQQVVARITF